MIARLWGRLAFAEVDDATRLRWGGASFEKYRLRGPKPALSVQASHGMPELVSSFGHQAQACASARARGKANIECDNFVCDEHAPCTVSRSPASWCCPGMEIGAPPQPDHGTGAAAHRGGRVVAVAAGLRGQLGRNRVERTILSLDHHQTRSLDAQSHRCASGCGGHCGEGSARDTPSD